MGEHQGEGGGYDRADALVWTLDRLIRDASAIAPRVRALGHEGANRAQEFPNPGSSECV